MQGHAFSLGLTRLDLAAGGTSYMACPWWPGSVGRLGRSLTASPWERLPTNRQLGRSREQRGAVTSQRGNTVCLGHMYLHKNFAPGVPAGPQEWHL